jgi:cyclophilin family peptidyl-prolyl cis-trans isomerase
MMIFLASSSLGNSFSFPLTTTCKRRICNTIRSCTVVAHSVQDDDDDKANRRPLVQVPEEEDSSRSSSTRISSNSDRRSFLQKHIMMIAAATSTVGVLTGTTATATASDVSTSSSSSSATAEITDKIYITVKGLKSGNAETIVTASGSVQPLQPQQTRRIVIGLFGKDAPLTVAKIKALVNSKPGGGGGLAAPCKPRDTDRSLQKEQLEANKVYNACIEGQDRGVTLAYSSIWRIVPNERIDFGAVSGKFVAREYPNFDEAIVNANLKHDVPGVVSVRHGNDGGFGFTIYPGGGGGGGAAADVSYLDEDHIVVGRVLPGESMDVVQELNAVPVIASSKAINYMALTGGTTTKNAPNRSCRYGGAMYCNENKPLLKLSITETGIL